MAQKKGVGSTRNGRTSRPKYRGIKRYGGQVVKAGEIIVRQCGTQFHPGNGVARGRDYTLYALISGYVYFNIKGRLKKRYVNIIPHASSPASTITVPEQSEMIADDETYDDQQAAAS